MPVLNTTSPTDSPGAPNDSPSKMVPSSNATYPFKLHSLCSFTVLSHNQVCEYEPVGVVFRYSTFRTRPNAYYNEKVSAYQEIGQIICRLRKQPKKKAAFQQPEIRKHSLSTGKRRGNPANPCPGIFSSALFVIRCCTSFRV